MRVKYIMLSCTTTGVCLILLMLVFHASLAMSASGQLDPAESWIDDFDSPTLDSRWEWVREDPTHWSLLDRPGFLRITTQEGSIFKDDNTGKNLVLTKPALEDFQITTKVTISPIENFHSAAVVIYQDDDNYIQLDRRYSNLDMITFRLEEGGIYSGWGITETATTVYLRIVKFGDVYASSYSIDGNNWIEVYQFNASFSNPKVGLTAYNGSSTLEIPADFDYFQLSEPGETLYVAPGADCGEADPCYATIQQAVDAGNPFDSIKVARGNFTDISIRPRDDFTTTGVVTQVVYLSKTLTILGGYTPDNWNTPDPQSNVSKLDAQGEGRVFYITGEINPKIEGLHITGGDAAGLGGDRIQGTDSMGGGIYVWKSLASIENNIIYNNSAEGGGGLFIDGPTWGFKDEPGAVIMDNTIISNTATSGGGGLNVSASSAVISGNLIQDNQAKKGAGLEAWLSSPQLYQNIIRDNTAVQTGGGIYFQWGYPTLVNNVIVDNHVENQSLETGNGLHVEGANLEMSNNTIARNSAVDNTGSGFYIVDLEEWGQPTINMTNTILADQTVGIFANGVCTLTVNSVLWYNTPVTITKSPTAIVSVSHQHTGDPSFAADGYHITAGSAAIDKGLNTGISVDIDDEPRPAGAGYDLGADELWIMIYLPMVTNK